MTGFWRSRWGQRVLICLFLFFLLLADSGTPGRLEYALLDLRFALTRVLNTDPFPVESAVILISSESEKKIGDVYGSHWRQFYPEIVQTLNESGAAAIVWDATFVAEEPEHDRDLAKAFRTIPVFAVENEKEINNREIRSSLKGIGWKQLIVSSGVPRKIIPDSPIPSLGAVLSDFLENERGDGGQPLWLDFSLDSLSVPVFELAELYFASRARLDDQYKTPLSVFKGKVVYIGLNLPGQDRYAVPGSRGALIPGVFSQLVSLGTHMSRRPIKMLPLWFGRLAVWALSVLLVLAGTNPIKKIRRIFVPLYYIVILLLPFLLFHVFRLWIPFSLLILINGSAFILISLTRRLNLALNYRTSLGFDPALLEKFSTEFEKSGEGVEKDAVVLCADIRNYTRLVSDHPGSLVRKVMSSYMTEMEKIISEKGGYINKYVGDEILAVFGFPLREEGAAQRAANAAREMIEVLKELNESNRIKSLPLIEGIGIGLDYGSLQFTRIGAGSRVQFDVIGNAVNGASRLEALTKELGEYIVLSSEAAAGIDNSLSLKPLGTVEVRGQGERELLAIASHRET